MISSDIDVKNLVRVKEKRKKKKKERKEKEEVRHLNVVRARTGWQTAKNRFDHR